MMKPSCLEGEREARPQREMPAATAEPQGRVTLPAAAVAGARSSAYPRTAPHSPAQLRAAPHSPAQPRPPPGIRRPGQSGRGRDKAALVFWARNGEVITSLGERKRVWGCSLPMSPKFPLEGSLPFGGLCPLLPSFPGAAKGRWLGKGEMLKLSKNLCSRKLGFW